MKNKLLITLLATTMTLLAGCDSTQKTSDSNSTSDAVSNDSASSNEEISSNSASSSTASEDSTYSYEEVTSTENLFASYADSDSMNFVAEYKCDVVQNRSYIGGWETSYMYDGQSLQLSYLYDSVYYTDFYIYDANTEKYTYYLDGGAGKYQFIPQDNEAFYQYASQIDFLNLADIDWAEECLFDTTAKQFIPTQLALQSVAKAIFGDQVNENWVDLTLNYEDGFITKIKGTSIYREAVYYYDVTLSDHEYATVSAPENATEYIDPNKPFYDGREDYTGVSLTETQAAAISTYMTEDTMNFTADIRWTLVNNGEIVTATYVDNKMEQANGNYAYSYTNSSTNLTNTDYLISDNEASMPVYYADNGAGAHTTYTYGMDNYSTYLSNLYIDRLLLCGLNPSDFIYDETKGYITAKNYETERTLIGNIFYFTANYGGLRIYLKENADGSMSFDKVVTSMYIVSDSSVISVVKEYKISEIGTTTVTAPAL